MANFRDQLIIPFLQAAASGFFGGLFALAVLTIAGVEKADRFALAAGSAVSLVAWSTRNGWPIRPQEATPARGYNLARPTWAARKAAPQHTIRLEVAENQGQHLIYLNTLLTSDEAIGLIEGLYDHPTFSQRYFVGGGILSQKLYNDLALVMIKRGFTVRTGRGSSATYKLTPAGRVAIQDAYTRRLPHWPRSASLAPPGFKPLRARPRGGAAYD